MFRIFFPSYSLQRRYQSVTILDLTKLVFGKGLEERLLHTLLHTKSFKNSIVLFFFFFFSVTPHCIKHVSKLNDFAFLSVID